ncbi:MAG: hypothetical protein GFH27_549291n260 [Chloroflexi bacterium AL-W]|nr:hypothetical protein [Chloroflexi bacterium AL-N1]NOK67272.1 hypothetical protein [Chloroflexi bacterium AL-N10]NOK75234.1 hypothetical protein [Chloroflexi bacterium AL-N5]NOK82022.1 hypothetical protein [Chloroflexi bacterium AL-W]NOK89867.1 hypothetical protein [Chloroflexi bacterium AL-N15]
MIGQTTVQPVYSTKGRLIRNTLRADGVFCGLVGMSAVAAAASLATLMGIPAPMALVALGIVCMVYATMLFALAAREQISRWAAITPFVLNILWVVDSVIVLAFGLLPLTTAGFWIVVILADIAAVFAIAQFIGIRRMLQ